MKNINNAETESISNDQIQQTKKENNEFDIMTNTYDYDTYKYNSDQMWSQKVFLYLKISLLQILRQRANTIEAYENI